LPDGIKVIAYNEIIHDVDSFYSRIIVAKMEEDKIFAKNITSEKARAFYPVVTSYGKNKIIVAWSEDEKICYRLLDAGDIKDKVTLPSDPHDYRIAGETGIKLANHADPVCSMHIDGDVQDTILSDKKIIGFCSKYCKEKFLHAPDEYKVE
jgi:YHS domain-containing protein